MQNELIIEAGRSEKHYWRDLWRYRELFYILSWRDIRVRYKQTVIGAAWGALRPLLTMAVFVFAFGYMGKMAQESTIPYALIVFSALLPWQFFSTALSESSNSLISNANLVSKVYFPRVIVPMASIITSMVDFLVSFGIMVVLMIFYRYLPPVQVLWLPVFILFGMLAAMGIGLYMTALNVKYRDFRYIVPFVVQLGTYVSPVGFSSTKVSAEFGETVRFWYSINPMVGVIDGFRWCILGQPVFWPGMYMSFGVTVFFLVLGIWYFRKTEKSFADNI